MVRALLMPLLVGSLLNLDRRAFLSCMIGRPIACGAIVGAVSGLPAQGLALGLWTELLWFWTIPVGGSYTPNPGLAVSAAVASLSLSRFVPGLGGDPTRLAPFLFVLVPALSHLLSLPDRINRLQSGRRAEDLLEEVRAGGRPSFFLRNLGGLLDTFLTSLCFLFLSVLAMTLALALSARLPGDVLGAFSNLGPFAPLVAFLGIAASLSHGSLAPYVLGLSLGVVGLSLLRAVF
jgi:hypothetical protein